MSDRIHIEGIRVDCVVGVYPRERTTAQPLVVDATLEVDTRAAARSERLAHTVHYGQVADQVRFLLSSCRFRLLETAADALCSYLLCPPAKGERRAQIERCRLRLTKPTALAGQAVPSLEVERDGSDVVLGHEEKPFGTVDVVYETRDAGIYRLNVAPGRGIPLHTHQVMDEVEMVLTDGLLCQGEPAAVGSVRRWPKGAKHRYDNPSKRVQSILCVDAPRFFEEDEVPATGKPTPIVVDR